MSTRTSALWGAPVARLSTSRYGTTRSSEVLVVNIIRTYMRFGLPLSKTFKMNACKFQGIIVERARVPLQLCEYIQVRNVSGPTPEMTDEEGWLRRQQGGDICYT